MSAPPAAEAAWPRPRLVASACLELEPCRFDGQKARARFLPRLAPFVDLLPVCPEVEVGLGVPRPALRLVSLAGEVRVLQPATARDVTEPMERFAAGWLGAAPEVDGFLLKSRSPSCGPRDVRVHAPEGHPLGERGAGVFAAAAAERHPLAAVEDEGRLTSYRLRHHFLTRLFQGARLRGLPESMAALVAFHAESKLLLLACDEVESRRLGRLAANPERLPAAEVKRRYRAGFARALARAPRPGPLVNALQHAFGHFSGVLVPAEKRVFLDLLHGYGARRAPLEAAVALLRGWNARHPRAWVEGQSLFRPYPEALHDLADSAGGAVAA